uniref:VWFA domain-containing protein n=1 Tax=Angiostrongylus cantonensis TaxID=6313 RepID=A0A158PAV4_ANGCA
MHKDSSDIHNDDETLTKLWTIGVRGAIWAGESSKVFMFNEDEEFLHAVSREIGVCSKEAEQKKIGDVEDIVENEKHTTLVQNPDLLSMKAKGILDDNSAKGAPHSEEGSGTETSLEELRVHGIRTANGVLKTSNEKNGASFFRSAVLDSLLSVRHSGGGTSVAKGITAALDEIQKNRRSGARLVVVLLSDGNSQDHWDDVVRSSNKLRTIGGDVYAVSTARNYMFRELELYAGSRLRVYIDGRVHKFLDDIEQQIVLCGRLAKSDESTIVLNAPKSCSTPIDLMLLLDTSSLSADEFYQEKQLAIDLLKAFPDSVFESRLSVSTISFAHNSTVVSAFGLLPKNEVIFELERTANASGPASLPTATRAALMEIKAHRRKGSRIIVVIFSSGNGGKDSGREVKESAISLRSSDAEVFAVSLSATANLEKLKEYTGNDKNLYMNRKSDSTESEEEPTHPDDIFDGNLIQFEPVGKRRKCVYEKMDLQIILDASSSRQEVFEHQKELALSLVERLPISAGGSKVAVGISSFTSVPIIRQTLGLGRNKKVVVLMNDGVSQDPWDRVLAASERLQSTKAEIFGVALGNKVDMRELQHYIGRNDRIYRDGMTEKFLNDVVNVLKGHKDCPGEKLFKELENIKVVRKKPSYSDAVIVALEYLDSEGMNSRSNNAYDKSSKSASIPQTLAARAITLADTDFLGRADAHAGLVILGNGKSGDSRDAQIAAGARIRETPSLTCFGVDTSSATNITVLKTFTGSASRVYPYQRTTEFAKQINRMANAANSPLCNFVLRGPRDGIRAAAAADFRLTAEWVYSTPDLLKTRSAIQHDILGEPLNIEKLSEGKVAQYFIA